MGKPNRKLVFLVAALLGLGLGISTVTAFLSPRSPGAVSTSSPVNCQDALSLDEPDQLTILASQETAEEETCLFVGCGSFF